MKFTVTNQYLQGDGSSRVHVQLVSTDNTARVEIVVGLTEAQGYPLGSTYTLTADPR